MPVSFLFFPLFVPFRGCTKLMSCFYGLIFCFSLPLFISLRHTLALSNLLLNLSAYSPFFPQIQSFISLPLASISFILSGVRPIHFKILWKSRVPERAAWSQISPFRSHSWPLGLNIERELRPWQSRKQGDQFR